MKILIGQGNVDDQFRSETPDQLYQLRNVVGIHCGGLDWAVNEKYMLSTNVMIQPWAEQVHAMEFAVTVGMSRSF